MTISDWAIVLATVSGPILAVQAQKYLERARDIRNNKHWIFSTLMATRATRVAAEHVQALNAIDMAFGNARWWQRGSSKDREVVEKWREYADHLNAQVDEQDAAAGQVWIARQEELFVDLLHAMSTALSYGFDRRQLRRGVYYPRAHGDQERRRHQYEEALVRIVTGESALPMKITELPVTEEAARLQREIQEKFNNAFDEHGAFRMKQVD